MTESFTTTEPGALARRKGAARPRVLVTGAAGRIGSYFAGHAHDTYDLRLLVQDMDDQAEVLRSYGEVVVGDLRDLNGLKDVCRGIDTVVHLAASPDPSATWDNLLENNIVGAYHIFVAARASSCRRVIFASSIHAVSGYPVDVQVKTNEPVNPGDLYGVSKCFGEALGRYMAEQEGLSVIAIRIGAFQPLEAARQEANVEMLDAFVSQRDLTQLIKRCIDVENLKFAVFHGLSNNRFKRLDISDARALLGYAPQDDLAAENPALPDIALDEDTPGHNLSDEQEKSGLREQLKGPNG